MTIEMEQEKNPEPQIKPRNGFIAFILALFFPGLGQIYNGQIKKAIVAVILLTIAPITYGLLRTEVTFIALIVLLVLQLIIQLTVILDAVIMARSQKDYFPKKYNTWYFHLIIAISITAVILVIDIKSILGVQSFSIPTCSNEPTVMVGDNVIVDTKAYDQKDPDYGDIIVFKQTDGYTYNYRLIGRPNDRISIENNFVTINDRICKYRFIEKLKAKDHPIPKVNNLKYEEELPNGKKHFIFKLEEFYDSTMINFEEIMVPTDSYFLLGDNRDNAADSRYFGFIRKEAIVGQMIFTLWGKSKNRTNVDFRVK
jgi:signal peptidase I